MSVHGIINYSTSICLFEPGECGQEGEKIQKIDYLENNEIKNIFHSF